MSEETQITFKADELCHGAPLRVTVGCLVATVSAMLVASVQSGFFTVVRPFQTVPDICLAFVIAGGMLFGSRFGAVSGVSAGFFIDSISGGDISARILIYLVCGFVAGLLGMPEKRPLRDVWRYMWVLVSACTAKQMIMAMWVLLTAPYLDIVRLFLNLILRDVACTAIFSVLIYFIVSAAYAIYKRSIVSKNRLSGR